MPSEGILDINTPMVEYVVQLSCDGGRGKENDGGGCRHCSLVNRNGKYGREDDNELGFQEYIYIYPSMFVIHGHTLYYYNKLKIGLLISPSTFPTFYNIYKFNPEV